MNAQLNVLLAEDRAREHVERASRAQVAPGRQLTRGLAAALIALVVAAALATTADARAPMLPIAEAERAARAAVAPKPIESLICVRPLVRRSGFDRSRAICLLNHPAPPSVSCRSIVEVKTPRRAHGATRARAIRLHSCGPSPFGPR